MMLSGAILNPNPSIDNIAISNTQHTDPLILNQLIVDPSLNWQIHNCKIIQMEASQDHPLPFLYHYDTLNDDIKAANPLTPQLLAKFNTLMSAAQACQLLGINKDAIPTPWQVKIVGTLVLYCESCQLALRLSFTNSAKLRDAIYTSSKDDAIKIAMQQWHFFGDVFVLYKHDDPLFVISNYQLDKQAKINDSSSFNYSNNGNDSNDSNIANSHHDFNDGNGAANINQNPSIVDKHNNNASQTAHFTNEKLDSISILEGLKSAGIINEQNNEKPNNQLSEHQSSSNPQNSSNPQSSDVHNMHNATFIDDHAPLNIKKSLEYQRLPSIYAVSVLTELATNKALMRHLDDAIQIRVQ